MTTTPKILGFEYSIPLSYLREGDRFIAWNPKTRWSRPGVAAMDGNYVSKDYGFRVGNLYYVDNDKDYINVKWDDMEYHWPIHSGKANTESAGVMNGPNSTIKATDGYEILVDWDTFKRFSEDMVENGKAKKRVQDLEKARQEVMEANEALYEAQVRLLRASNKVKELERE